MGWRPTLKAGYMCGSSWVDKETNGPGICTCALPWPVKSVEDLRTSMEGMLGEWLVEYNNVCHHLSSKWKRLQWDHVWWGHHDKHEEQIYIILFSCLWLHKPHGIMMCLLGPQNYIIWQNIMEKAWSYTKPSALQKSDFFFNYLLENQSRIPSAKETYSAHHSNRSTLDFIVFNA